MSRIIVRDDGVYLRDDTTNHEVLIDTGVFVVNGDGSVTIRFPPRDVTIVALPDTGRTYDMGDLARLVVAVVRGALTIAQINAISPQAANAVQTFMTNHGLTAAGSPQP